MGTWSSPCMNCSKGRIEWFGVVNDHKACSSCGYINAKGWIEDSWFSMQAVRAEYLAATIVLNPGKEKLGPIEDFEGAYDYLSNFHYANVPIMYGGNQYKTTEHAYQAAKTLDKEERKLVQRCETPGQAKRMGQKVTKRDDWEEIKYSVMHDLVRQKFRKNKQLGLHLLTTDDRELIEGNTWNDTYWGVCRGVGQNNLGKILMDIRAELKSEALCKASKIKRPEF